MHAAGDNIGMQHNSLLTFPKALICFDKEEGESSSATRLVCIVDPVRMQSTNLPANDSKNNKLISGLGA